MGAIDIGNGADSDLGLDGTPGYTGLDMTNPANDSGYITSFEIWVRGHNETSCKIGTFSGSQPNWTSRDYENIGSVVYGSKQTFTGLNCSVATNDIIGAYTSVAHLNYNSGGLGFPYALGDLFDGDSHSYSLVTIGRLALYGTGSTDAPVSAIVFIPKSIIFSIPPL